MKRIFCALALSLVLVSPAWAFPDNGVLDTFTGVDDSSPPNANWTNGNISASTNGCDLEDNAATSNATGSGSCHWNPTTFDGDANQEAYATIVNIGNTTSAGVCVRLVQIGNSTTDGYCVRWADVAATVEIFRVDNRSFTLLGSAISQTITTTDKIGIRAVGDQICAWFSDSGGAWTELGCRTDSTHAGAGKIGMEFIGTETVGAMDDFGGGNVTVATITPTRRRAL